MTFHIGQKLVCVDADFEYYGIVDLNLPVHLGVYTVRDVVTGRGVSGLGLGLLLEEICNRAGPYGTEYSFVPDRFRPVVERKTDISIFEKMLTEENVSANLLRPTMYGGS